MINYIALLIALSLSGVSAYYSITGLATLFSSAFNAVICMGIVLELGKLITASWLYNNWNICSRLLKIYLTIAVMILIMISSIGIYGFLAKAHIEQTLNINTGVIDQIKIIESKIDIEKQNITDIDKQLSQIDNAINKINDKNSGANSLKAADQQRKTRNDLLNKKQEYNKKIAEYTQEKIKLESNNKKLEAEIGPLKYIANLIYDNATNDELEKSVRWLIILLVCVFDPLAVLLTIASQVGIENNQDKNVKKKILVINNKNLD